MVTLVTLQQQRQSWETNVSDLLPVHALSVCDTVSAWNREDVSRQCDVIIRFDLDLKTLCEVNTKIREFALPG